MLLPNFTNTGRKSTPPDEANIWLLLVHIMIGNIKKFIMESFMRFRPDSSRKYIDEFRYTASTEDFKSWNTQCLFVYSMHV